MGLYLCVFASSDLDEEVDGVEVGSYDDFHTLRTAIAEQLEGGRWGSRFPTLMSHADSAGEWSAVEAAALAVELGTIEEELRALPASGLEPGSWQAAAAKLIGLVPTSLAGCFIDVDGEPLFDRLRGLAQIAVDRGRPISFQ